MSNLVYLVPFLLALGLLMANLVGSHDRMLAADPEAFSTPSAEYLARLFRLRSIVSFVLIGALVFYGAVSDDLVAMMKFSSPVFLVVVVAAIRSWKRGSRALRLLGATGGNAELYGDFVIVQAGDEVVQLGANGWMIARARRHGLPAARRR